MIRFPLRVQINTGAIDYMHKECRTNIETVGFIGVSRLRISTSQYEMTHRYVKENNNTSSTKNNEQCEFCHRLSNATFMVKHKTHLRF